MNEKKYTPEEIVLAIYEAARPGQEPEVTNVWNGVTEYCGLAKRLMDSLDEAIKIIGDAFMLAGELSENWDLDIETRNARFTPAAYRRWFYNFNSDSRFPLPLPDVLKIKEERRHPLEVSAPIEAAPVPVSVEPIRPDYWPEEFSPADVMEALNPNGPRYSVELATALYAWTLYGVSPLETFPQNRKTPKKRIEWLLENNPTLKALYSELAPETQKRIGIVANWNKTAKNEIDR